jgi:hypothetical protein
MTLNVTQPVTDNKDNNSVHRGNYMGEITIDYMVTTLTQGVKMDV